MTRATRTVHTLRLRAPDAASCRRGAILLEDALHTATLPDGDGGRVYILRSLSLGTVRLDAGSVPMAAAIKARCEQICGAAVHAGSPGAVSSPAVWFADSAEAYRLLATRLARQEEASAWFWPLAVPSWRPELPRDMALRRLLHSIAGMESPPGSIAVARWVTELHAQRALAPLLAALTREDGVLLLRGLGWPLPAAAASLEGGTAIAQASSPAAAASPIDGSSVDQEFTNLARDPVLVNALLRWGGSDARSLWLAGVLLAAPGPAFWLDPTLRPRAMRLIRQVIASASAYFPPAPEEIETGNTAPAHSGEVLHSSSLDPTVQNLPPATERLAPTTEYAAPAEQPLVAPAPGTLAAGFDEISSWHALTQTERQTAAVGPLYDHPSSTLPITEPSITPSPDVTMSARQWNSAGSISAASSDAARLHPPLPDAMRGASAPSVAQRLADIPQPTRFAGLYFLTSPLSRLGMAALLEAHPHLIACDFPIRLLHHLGRALGIAANDPVLAALPLPAASSVFAGDDAPQVAFTMAAAWRRDLCDARPLLRRRLLPEGDDAGWEILFDSSGRLALAAWRGATPEAVMQLLQDQPDTPVVPIPFQPVETLLLDSWRRAVRRWCRRYAALGLATIVRRPGSLLATSTHIDIRLDLRLAEVRVRKAGLDIDPGWVPWLGRVILFHYLIGESHHADA